jgi:transcription antitermination protein NusB
MSRKPPPMAARRRSAARLAAVQSLYQMELSGGAPDEVVRDYLAHRIDTAEPAEADELMVEPDGDMLTQIVFGATMQKEKLDSVIAAHLSGEWTVERLETVLRAVLRAGAFELTHRDDIPPKVTITEYVDIAHAFYAGAEPGLVNAVLDRIARQDRGGEMGSQ